MFSVGYVSFHHIYRQKTLKNLIELIPRTGIINQEIGIVLRLYEQEKINVENYMQMRWKTTNQRQFANPGHHINLMTRKILFKGNVRDLYNADYGKILMTR